MRKLSHLAVLLLIFSVLCPPAQAQDNTWTSTDALGRKLPTFEQAGPKRPDKLVGIFYWTWHGSNRTNCEPVSNQLVTQLYPEAINDYEHPIWQQGPLKSLRNHWNEPLFGYYRTTDPWVLRHHAQMLADAGIDLIVFDATNGSFTWKESYDVLLEVFDQARRDGVRVPRFAFMLPFGPWPHSKVSLQKIYDDIYKPGRYKELWFQWKGKPLVMAYPDNIPEPMRSFFTFRPGQPSCIHGPTRPDHWGWLEVSPLHGFVKTPTGGFEEVAIGVSQNATPTLTPAAMNSKDEVFGRGYTKEHGPNHSQDAIHRGLNFQEQWDRAHKLDPELVFVTGWNEWTAGRYKEWQKTTNAFPDQFNDEYSRDIEPVNGNLGDNYYHQLITNVRRFKGMDPPLKASGSGPTAIAIDGKFDDWKDVQPEYRDHRGDTLHRKHPGYGKKLIYTNTTGRNDLVVTKVAHDPNGNLHFYAQTAKPITSPEGPGWMTLYLDLDRNKKTGWEGYDLVINRVAPTPESPSKNSPSPPLPLQATVECSQNGQAWQALGQATLRFTGNQLELSLPRVLLRERDFPLNFEFKWSDNTQPNGQVMRFYTDGDAAPDGRFNYFYAQ